MSRFVPAPDLAAALEEVARPALTDTAPELVRGARRKSRDDSGHYDRSLRVFNDERGIGAMSTDIAGHIIEWGSIDTPAQAPMRTAAADLGRYEPK